MINHYTRFKKDTMCFSCAGCPRCELKSFNGIVGVCHSYRSADIKNKLIDDVCRKFEQTRMRRNRKL